MQSLSWLSPPSNQDLIIKDIKHFPILNSFSLTHACHRNVLRHFRFKLFSMGKPYKFGVTTINIKIPNAFKGIKDSTGLPFEEHPNFVCYFFDDDFNKAEIAAELRVLKELYFNAFGQEKPRLTIKDVLAQLSSSQKPLIKNVWRLFHYCLCYLSPMPPQNAHLVLYAGLNLI